MSRRITARPSLVVLLLAAALALALAALRPAGADALGPIVTQTPEVGYLPERICRPHLTCTARFDMTFDATISVAPGEGIAGPNQRIVMDVYGDDAFSDDHLLTISIPYRAPGRPAVCDDEEGEANSFYRVGNTLRIRGCVRSAKGYGPLNEDDSFLDDWDEVYARVRLVDSRGTTLRSARTRDMYGRF